MPLKPKKNRWWLKWFTRTHTPIQGSHALKRVYIFITAQAVHIKKNTTKSEATTLKILQRMHFSHDINSLSLTTANNLAYLQLGNLPKSKAELIPLFTKQQVSIRVLRINLCVDEVDLIVRVWRFDWKAVFNLWLSFIVLQRGMVVVFFRMNNRRQPQLEWLHQLLYATGRNKFEWKI